MTTHEPSDTVAVTNGTDTVSYPKARLITVFFLTMDRNVEDLTTIRYAELDLLSCVRTKNVCGLIVLIRNKASQDSALSPEDEGIMFPFDEVLTTW